MAKKSVELIFWIRDKVSPVLSKIKIGLKGVTGAITSMAKIATAAFAAMGAGAFGLWKTVKQAFDFETAQVQLKSLLGSMDLAKKRFAELRKFSAETPFQLPDILKASRLLTVFSEGVLGGAESLKGIGDAAAVAGQGISDVAFWVGRAYSMIQGGKPFGEASMRLQEMGILTAKARTQMENLQKSGASADDVFGVLTKELVRFNGGMSDLSKTGNGLISTLKDNWTIAVARFGEAFMDMAKGGLTTAINTIKRLVEDGTIDRWANRAKEALTSIAQAVKIITAGTSEDRRAVFKAFASVLNAIFQDAVSIMISALAKAIPAIGAAMGDAFLGSVKSLGMDDPTNKQRDDAVFKATQETMGTDKSFRAAYKRQIAEIKLQNQRERLAKKGMALSESLSSESSNFARTSEEFVKTMADLSKQYEEVAKEVAKPASAVVSSTKNESRKAVSYIQRAYDAITGGKSSGGPSSNSSGFESIASKISGSLLSTQQMGLATLRAQTFERKGQEAGVGGLAGTFSDMIGAGKSIYEATEAVNRILQGATTAMLQGESASQDPISELVAVNTKTNEILENKLGTIQ